MRGMILDYQALQSQSIASYKHTKRGCNQNFDLFYASAPALLRALRGFFSFFAGELSEALGVSAVVSFLFFLLFVSSELSALRFRTGLVSLAVPLTAAAFFDLAGELAAATGGEDAGGAAAGLRDLPARGVLTGGGVGSFGGGNAAASSSLSSSSLSLLALEDESSAMSAVFAVVVVVTGSASVSAIASAIASASDSSAAVSIAPGGSLPVSALYASTSFLYCA